MNSASNTFCWYVVYTKPRWEKKVHALFQQKKITSYCPLQKIVRQWADRKKKVEFPVFPSYIFVNITPEQQPLVRMVNGVVNFVYWLGKPARIKDEEIKAIQSFLESYEEVSIESDNLTQGDMVKIKHGLLKNQVATVKHVAGNKVMLHICQLGILLKATVEKIKLQKIV